MLVCNSKDGTRSVEPCYTPLQVIRASIVYGLSLVVPASAMLAAGTMTAKASPSAADRLGALQRSSSAQEAKLNQEEIQLKQQSLELSQQQQLLDSVMAKLRGTGAASANQPAPLKMTPDGADRLRALQRSISVQEAKLSQEEIQLEQQSLELGQQQQLLDSEMENLRGAGAASADQSAPLNTAPPPPGVTSQTAPSAPPDNQDATASGQVGTQQQQQQKQQQQQQAKVILQSATTLSNAGGILTPKGQLVIDPSLEYENYSQNQLALNGFTIIPGITFGNLFISRTQQNFATAALSMRYGVTNRLELNMKIPFVVGYGTLTAQAAGPNATPLSTSANNANLGDIQLGAAYQFNSGNNGWPVFIGNLVFKSATGISPYQVPIYTVDDPNGQYLDGIDRKLPTGTGFYALEPSLTVFYATDPGVIFGNIQYIKNFSRSFNVPNPAGGAATPENLQPGSAVTVTFGLGFALNEQASMTFSYEQEHVFGASVDNVSIHGSSYDFGTFNFGLGYQVNRRTSINLGIGIGAGPNAPVSNVLLEVPTRFNVF